MRTCLFAFLGLLVATTPSCSQQSQVAPADKRKSGTSSTRLVFEVLETNSGVHGTTQLVYIRVFSDRSVEYHPKRSQELRRDRVSLGEISEDELNITARVLAREDVAKLPPVFKSTFTPKDFNWTLDLGIPRGTEVQRITVANFSPAMAVRNNKTYPVALVRLVCAAWAARTHLTTETPDLSKDCREFAGQN